MTSETAATTAGSNYARYWSAPFNRPEHYPVGLTPDPTCYQPIGAWLGRLILPTIPERPRVMGAWLELHHAPAEHHALVGQKVRLRWEHTPALNAALWGAARKVLLPWGSARDDWEYGVANLGTSGGLLGSVGKALGSWRTLLPPVVARAIVEVLLEHGASAWALRTFQVGGHDPTIEPVVPKV